MSYSHVFFMCYTIVKIMAGNDLVISNISSKLVSRVKLENSLALLAFSSCQLQLCLEAK